MTLAALDQKFSILDALPDTLYDTAITHPHGELLTRVQGILQWRQALLAGELPKENELVWPEPGLRRAILKRLEVLDITRFCREQEELTDNVLQDICEGIQTAEEYYRHKPGGFVDTLAQRQNVRDRASPFDDPEHLADHVQDHSGSDEPSSAENGEEPSRQPGKQDNGGPSPGVEVKHAGEAEIASGVGETEPQLRPHSVPNPQEAPGGEAGITAGEPGMVFDQTEPQIADQAVLAVAPDLLEQRWAELAESWHQLEEIFSELGGLLGRGWDLTQGVLASQGWRDIVRYRKWVKKIPELQALIRTLGRLQAIDGEGKTESVSEKIFNPIKRLVKDEEETITQRMVMETGGIERSDELSRMLPSELTLLGHPKLNLLWHAKRAERMLVTYSYSGLMPEVVETEKEQEQEGPPQEDRADQGLGPIIVCLDTSGSMEGQPEQIAKALVLEALRIAWIEQRPCHVYTFGGPEEILEHELDLTRDGLGKLLEFLQMSFHGGTDVAKPLLLALEKQYSQRWEAADILLISDGRFPQQSDLFGRINRMKDKQALRVHGLLLGDWKGTAIEQICDPLHRFTDWEELIEERNHAI